MEFQFNSVSVHYERIPALRDVSCTIRQRDIIVLNGHTGAGKTTFLRLLYMDIFPTSGTVLLGGQDTTTIRKRYKQAIRRKMGIVFQDCKLIDSRTVYENVSYPLYAMKHSKKEADKRSLEVLSEINISYLRNKFPHELSGGEKHLVALARAIIHKPELIIADEPTGNLDDQASQSVADILHYLAHQGATVILATHSKKMRAFFADARLFQLHEGVLLQSSY